MNQAFIDGQNLRLGTTKASDPWKVDLKKLRVYLIKKERFEKLLSPSKKSTSSLYKRTADKFRDYLDNDGIRKKIEYIKETDK